MLLSPNGAQLYVVAKDDNSISWFDRNPVTGSLLYFEGNESIYSTQSVDSNITITVIATYVDGLGNNETVTSNGILLEPNYSPTDLNSSSPLTILENQPIGTGVGILSASDANANPTAPRIIDGRIFEFWKELSHFFLHNAF